MASWHYEQNGQTYGPVDSAGLKRLAARGPLLPSDRVRRDGGEWVQASRVRGLFAAPAGDAAQSPGEATAAPVGASGGIGADLSSFPPPRARPGPPPLRPGSSPALAAPPPPPPLVAPPRASPAEVFAASSAAAAALTSTTGTYPTTPGTRPPGMPRWGWLLIGGGMLLILAIPVTLVVLFVNSVRHAAQRVRAAGLQAQQRQQIQQQQPSGSSSSGGGSGSGSGGTSISRQSHSGLLDNADAITRRAKEKQEQAQRDAERRKREADEALRLQQKHLDQERKRQAERDAIEAERAPTPANFARWLTGTDPGRRDQALQRIHDGAVPAESKLPPGQTIPPDVRRRIHDGICNLVVSSDRTLQWSALRALAEIGTEEDFPLLTRLAAPAEANGTPPIAAAAALRINPARAMPLLEAHAKDKDWAAHVYYEFRNYGPRCEAACAAMLHSPTPDVRWAALAALRELGTPRSIPVLDEWHARETDKNLLRWYDLATKAILERAQGK